MSLKSPVAKRVAEGNGESRSDPYEYLFNHEVTAILFFDHRVLNVRDSLRHFHRSFHESDGFNQGWLWEQHNINSGGIIRHCGKG